MPTGKVKWYDPEKGFGFIANDEGEDVYVHSSALPQHISELKPGQKVEFGMAAGRKGPQVLTLTLLDPPLSVSKVRKDPNFKKLNHDELHGMIEDMIKLLEATVQPELRRKKYPDRESGTKVAGVLRAIAQQLDN